MKVRASIVFVACGLNHKTAPLSVREQLAWPVAQHDALLQRWLALPAVHEVILLSTCNRTEIYCNTDEPDRVIAWLAQLHQVPLDSLAPHVYIHRDTEGVRHLLRVASGLDSMMLGEPQILGQLKQAYTLSRQQQGITHTLRAIFQYVFRASKHIRHQSGIGRHPVSIAFAAVQQIATWFPEEPALTILIIGSGDTSSLVGKYLHEQARHRFLVASRTHEHAARLAQTIGGEAINITDLASCLPKVDIVISATTCPMPFISKQLVEEALRQRQQAPMFFLDLAVPRDIEPDVAMLDGATLCNIDTLQTRVEHGFSARQAAAVHAEELVGQSLEDYGRWHRAQQTRHLIRDYREHMQLLAQNELQRAQQRLTRGLCPYAVLSEFNERLFKKLTHTPTVGLRHAAWDNQKALLDLAHYLFSTEEKNLA